MDGRSRCRLHRFASSCPCARSCRVGAWVKPFASFKPGVNPGYCWEPLIWCGGGKLTRDAPTVRDFCAESITMRRGFPGAKPEAFCFWLFELLGMTAGDEFHDLFPGSGAVGRAWAEYRRRLTVFDVAAAEQLGLFDAEGAG